MHRIWPGSLERTEGAAIRIQDKPCRGKRVALSRGNSLRAWFGLAGVSRYPVCDGKHCQGEKNSDDYGKQKPTLESWTRGEIRLHQGMRPVMVRRSMSHVEKVVRTSDTRANNAQEKFILEIL
jgi:hypothetical protein